MVAAHGIWLLVPLAPLLLALPALRWPERAGRWLWLACVPAVLAAWLAPAPFDPTLLWTGAQWGGSDPLSRWWLAFTALLWGLASIFAGSALRRRRKRFWLFWQLSLAGNLLLIAAADGISFYVGFSVMSLAAYGLVVHLGGGGPRRAGRVYLQLAVLAEMLVFAGLVLRFYETGGASDFASWAQAPIGAGTALLLLLGFGIKMGFWPLHVWLPLAHPAAPAAASAVLSGAMIKAGALGLWRFFPDAGLDTAWWSEGLLAVAVISAFYGVAVGLLQRGAKAVLAYSSVSQMGYLLAILALAWSDPGNRLFWGILLAAYGVHHGLAKGALFLGAGLSANARLPRGYWLLMALPALGLAGMPGTAGALVKLLLKDGIAAGPWQVALPLLSAGALATALLVLRALWLMVHQAGDKPPANGQLVPWAILSLMPVLLPWLGSEPRQLLLDSVTAGKLTSLAWPIVAAALAALIAGSLVVRSRVSLRWLPRVRANAVELASLRLKRHLRQPPFPPLTIALDRRRWRNRERSWNRFWQRSTVAYSALTLTLLLLVGWLWWL